MIGHHRLFSQLDRTGALHISTLSTARSTLDSVLGLGPSAAAVCAVRVA